MGRNCALRLKDENVLIADEAERVDNVTDMCSETRDGKTRLLMAQSVTRKRKRTTTYVKYPVARETK